MLTYETRNHWFITDNNKKIELTNKEHELLTALVEDTLVSYDELSKRLYNLEPDACLLHALHINQARLQKKTKIDIKTIRGKGLILKTKILFK